MKRLIVILLMVGYLALVPLLIGAEEPGKELLHPLAVVIFGGLVTSTVVSLIFTPAIFYRFRNAGTKKVTS